jgi:hypothetical protein
MGNGKRGFDFDKYYGLFFDQLVFGQLASGRRAVGLYPDGLNGANGTILRRTAMGAGAA